MPVPDNAISRRGWELANPSGRANLAAIAAGQIGGAIGEPGRVALARNSPAFTFICPVALTPGCLPPPGLLPCRIGSGASLDLATARDLCLLEGIERYSLQYREGDPSDMLSGELPGAAMTRLSTSRLRLGHPAQRDGGPLLDSRGCSVGAGFADAALRGLLELAEHEAFEEWLGGSDGSRAVDPRGASSGLDALIGWLDVCDLQLRVVDHRHRSGASAFTAITSELNGVRPAVGSAAGLEAAPTLLSACLESVVTWFNVAEIDKNRIRLADLPPSSRRTVEFYRGLSPLPVPEKSIPGRWNAAPDLAAGLAPEAAFGGLLENWKADVAVFDLTRHETGITAVRVTRLDE